MSAPRPDRSSISIAGVGESGCVVDDPRSIPEMVLCAVENALVDAGATYDDIDAVVTASIDLFDGLTASNIAVTEVVGAVMRPETRIAADGLAAAIHAAAQIWAGAYGTVLVVAHGKASMSQHDMLTSWAMDPIHLQPLGANFLICSALQAQMMRGDDSKAEARWASIASKRRSEAGDEGIKPACTTDEVLNSEVISSPLRQDMRAPLGDGAYAVLLKRSNASSSIQLTGVGHDLSAHCLWDEHANKWAGLGRASERALTMARVDSTQIDLFEPSCHFAHEEILFADACALPESARVSPTGGLFAGVAPATGGLARLITATRLMRENPDYERALAHGSWGPAGQGQAVAILEANAA